MMTDTGPGGSEPTGSGGEKRLPSARERAHEGREGRPSRGRTRDRRADRHDRRKKPKPARTLSEATPRSHGGEPEPVQAGFEADGAPWTVRVVGRSAGGRGVAGATLMLLGFWKGEPSDPPGPPELELLTVARPLGSLSPRELGEALGRATQPVDADESKPFFPDPRERRRR